MDIALNIRNSIEGQSPPGRQTPYLWKCPGDLNLPGLDGRAVLRQVKADPSLRRIPVIVLTTSNAEKDVEQCYADGANSYVQKPVDIHGFVLAICRLKDFWFEIAILPKDAES